MIKLKTLSISTIEKRSQILLHFSTNSHSSNLFWPLIKAATFIRNFLGTFHNFQSLTDMNCRMHDHLQVEFGYLC